MPRSGTRAELSGGRTLVLAGLGRNLHWVPLPEGPIEAIPWAPDVASAVRQIAHDGPGALPDGLLRRLGTPGTGERIVVIDPALSSELEHRSGRAVEIASLTEARRARDRLPVAPPEEERDFLRALARRRLELGLRSPVEVLITLAREEERVERAVGREERAAESFVSVPGSTLATYAEAWAGARAALDRHHRILRAEVEAAARDLLPNLASVVGALTAARLLSAAGSLDLLGRMGSSRLQILGARRRPSADRGPRFGVLYRADRMEDVPLARRGAYARSLASLAVIAARADATTRSSVAPELVARRDRRIDRLRRRLR